MGTTHYLGNQENLVTEWDKSHAFMEFTFKRRRREMVLQICMKS